MSLKVVVLIFATIYQNFSFGDPVIQLPNGKIMGRKSLTYLDTLYYRFEKIPYAAPPVDNLRFKPPQPPKNWDNILNATRLDVSCYQLSHGKDQSEDCLFVNVYTPEYTNVSLPVLFFIHGGGFVDGSSINLGSDHYINNGIIVVTFNYRLGPFGFLSTQDAIIPGNNGLKDQHLALQWTHDNIKLFGGDPSKIIIAGHSAGSASVGYHLLNQKSRGLFRAAICQSGSLLSPWAYHRRANNSAAFMIESLQVINNSTDLLELLQSVPAEDLNQMSEAYFASVISNMTEELAVSRGYFWGPVIEPENKDAFITEEAIELLQTGKVVDVPLLIGFTSEETLFLNLDRDLLEKTMEEYDQNLDWLVPDDMKITDKDKREEMGQSIRKIYTQGEPFAENLGASVRFFSDISFSVPVMEQAKRFSKFAKTYFYQFSYDGQFANTTVHYDGAGNVSHGAEQEYLFCIDFKCDLGSYPELVQMTQKRFVTLWTNFIKYLNPTPEPLELLQNITWPAVSPNGDDFLYLDINENLEVKNHPKEKFYKGWKKLYNSLNITEL